MWKIFLLFLFIVFVAVFIIKPEIITGILSSIKSISSPASSESYSCSFENQYGFGCAVKSWETEGQAKGAAVIEITNTRLTNVHVEYLYCQSSIENLYLDKYPINGTNVDILLTPNQKITVPIRCLDYGKGSYRGHLFIWYFESIANENRHAVGSITIYPKLE